MQRFHPPDLSDRILVGIEIVFIEILHTFNVWKTLPHT